MSPATAVDCGPYTNERQKLSEHSLNADDFFTTETPFFFFLTSFERLIIIILRRFLSRYGIIVDRNVIVVMSFLGLDVQLNTNNYNQIYD